MYTRARRVCVAQPSVEPLGLAPGAVQDEDVPLLGGVELVDRDLRPLPFLGRDLSFSAEIFPFLGGDLSLSQLRAFLGKYSFSEEGSDRK